MVISDPRLIGLARPLQFVSGWGIFFTYSINRRIRLPGYAAWPAGHRITGSH